MSKQNRKQKLAEALAEEAAGIDIEILEGGESKRAKQPETLSPEEQQARDQAFVQRFTGLGGLQPQVPSDTLSNIDTVSEIDTVSNNDTVETSTPAKRSAPKPPPRKKKPTPLKAAEGDATIAQILERNGNQPVTLESGFTAVLWTVDDLLAPQQMPAEQTIYRHLYRLAYGFGNTHCFVGYDTLRRRCQMTTNTLRKALAALEAKKHIAILENVNTRIHKSTVYRVFLPEEIKGLEKELEEYKKKQDISSVGGEDTVSKIDTTRTDIFSTYRNGFRG